MKFAQYLNDHAVPEWKSQYLDYKQGKKKLKKINNLPFSKTSKTNTPIPNSNISNNVNNNNTINNNNNLPITKLRHIRPDSTSNTPHHAYIMEITPNTGVSDNVTSSGNTAPRRDRRSSLVSFQLPPPALNSSSQVLDKTPEKRLANDRTPLLSPRQHGLLSSFKSTPPFKYTENDEQDSLKFYNLVRKRSRIGSFVLSLRSNSFVQNDESSDNTHELALYSEFSKNEFMSWVNDELIKVETFYRERERHDVERFILLQNQMFQLRQQRALVKQKIKKLQDTKNDEHQKLHPLDKSGQELLANKLVVEIDHLKASALNKMSKINKFELPSLPSLDWLLGKEKAKEYYEDGYNSGDGDEDTAVSNASPSSNEETPTSEEDDERDLGLPSYELGNSSSLGKKQDQRFNRRDYSRKDTSQNFTVPYYIARRQIKTAMFELYRSLELLKSYRIINRTAFRKMIKKFDKTTGSSTLNSFMEKIDQCYFTKSDILDEVISKIEDLFAMNFEKGNRKIAVAKLRSSEVFKTYYSEFFTSGVFMGLALPLFVLGLYRGLHDTIKGIMPEGRFLLQIWGGFVLLTLMALLFGVNCYIWTEFKINYKFIFEFDGRTSLDFRQFFLSPSLSIFMISFFGWFSFENFWPTDLPGRYWPWFYVGFMLLILFCPFEIFHYHSRKWFLYSVWRLIFSGFYPVEFRDFFLGDIFCSLTYALSNISFFICLYATRWRGALTGSDTVCGSSHSRLMGFLGTLPSIWRFMQCIRRYLDTGDWFPHLANCMKYTISTIYYVLLSVWRIDRTVENRAVFIVFASINSVYSAIWDIFMDWSLMQAGSKNLFLRDTLIFKKSWFYYVAMVFDVILRFQWIFYAFFDKQIQQSAVTSFAIALAEVLRRFVWIFFRMENEHCTNVHLFRASRDTPLPYPINKAVVNKKYEDYLRKIKPLEVSAPTATLFNDEERTAGLRLRRTSTVAGPTDIVSSHEPDIKPLARRSTMIPAGLEKISHMLNSAHIKDFQRRKVKPTEDFAKEDSDDDDEEDEENESSDDDQQVIDEAMSN